MEPATAAVTSRATTHGDALVERAMAGDSVAFETLVATRIDRCYRLAFAILGDASDSADATQEAFVAAWRQLPRLRDPASFDSWLNRIVANAARMSRRHRGRLREVRMVTLTPAQTDGADRSWEPADAGAARQLESVAASDAIGRAFDRLSERDRLILVLHHVEERPVAEIAKTLGVPLGTAKWRLHAARTSLERAMEIER